MTPLKGPGAPRGLMKCTMTDWGKTWKLNLSGVQQGLERSVVVGTVGPISYIGVPVALLWWTVIYNHVVFGYLRPDMHFWSMQWGRVD